MEGLGEGVKEVDILLLQGGEVGTDGAEDIRTFLGSESAGDFLFDLGHANGLFGKVIGKRNKVINSEAPDVILVGTQPPDQVGGVALLGPTWSSRFRYDGILGIGLSQYLLIAELEVAKLCDWHWPVENVDYVAGGDQQIDHASSPRLVQFFEEIDQFTQMMDIAQAVLARSR